MEKKIILSELKEVLAPYIQNKEAFEKMDYSTDFIKDLKINSANLVDIILDIEDKYNIEIDNESMEKMMNVEDAISIIIDKIG